MNRIIESLRHLSESTLLLEYDRKDLRKWAGEDLSARFFAIRTKLQAPENDLGYWIKKGDLAEFEKFVNNWETGTIKSKTQQKKDERIAGAELILDEKGWKVYHVTSYEAAKQLGSNTTWCITGRYRGYENRGKHYFDSYIKDYNLDGYYFIFDTLNKDHNDVAKYCAGVDGSGNLKFLYNGMQDREISGRGIPNITPDRQIELLPMVHIPFNNVYEVKEGILTKVDFDALPNSVANLPEGVVEIPKRFFENQYIYGCLFPTTLRKIGLGAFTESRIESFNILDNIPELELGTGICFGCNNLETVKLFGGINRIPSKAFAYCDRLRQVFIGVDVEIADDAFVGCPEDLTVYTDSQRIVDYCKSHNIQVASLSDSSL